MDLEELRLECLRLAAESDKTGDPQKVVEAALRMFEFVTSAYPKAS